MTRYLPIVVGVLLIVGLTIRHAQMSDRFAASNVSAEQRAELLRLIPMSFGDWHGEDKPVDPEVKAKAGSIGEAVSRNYRNARTGERVDLWLIVGHAREISAHTPDVCYPGAGFEARGKENGLYPLVINGQEASFWTNTFYKEDVTGRHLLRVFWTWFNSESKENQGKVVWESPQNARWVFGNTRALYKMYFTSEMRDSMETPDQSSCIHFARDFLPEVEKALTQVSAPGTAKSPELKAASGESSAEVAPSTSAGADLKADAPAGETTTKDANGGAAPQAGPEGKAESPPPSNDGK
jgi:hypothetical protein